MAVVPWKPSLRYAGRSMRTSTVRAPPSCQFQLACWSHSASSCATAPPWSGRSSGPSGCIGSLPWLDQAFKASSAAPAQSPIARRGRSGCLPADGNHVWFAVNMLDTR